MASRDAITGLNKIPIIRIFVPYASGILAGEEWGKILEKELQLLFVCGIWLVLFLLFQWNRKGHAAGHLGFSSLCFLVIAGLGFSNGRITLWEPPDFPSGEVVLIHGRITEEPKRNGDRWQSEMDLFMLATRDTLFRTKTTLGIYMGMPADSVFPGAGEEWQMAGRLQPVRNNGNPGETDYASILGRRGYWYRCYVVVDSPMNRRAGTSRAHWFRAPVIRDRISRHWQGDTEAVMLLKAVCLGDRSQLTGELREAYSGAGGMHLLAVSGLHVGLIWWVLQHLFSILVRLTRSELSRVIPILLLLWCYAFLTGMSSSVSRSVTMFTLFSVARLIRHRTHPVQTILLAAFLMTVVMPGRLREVGFQLSYCAVLGIVTLYPLLRDRPFGRIRNRLLRRIWEASAVSLAAQVATAPLVIFYFRQIPVYALLTNLVAIPVMGGLITLFVVSVPFLLLGWFPMLWSRMLLIPAKGLNHLMEMVSEIPGAVLPVTGTDITELLCWMTILLLVIIALSGRLRVPGYGILFMLAVLTGYTSLQLWGRKYTGELMVTHFYNGSLLMIREGPRVDCYRWNADSATARSMERYVSEVWGGREYNIRWMDRGERSASLAMTGESTVTKAMAGKPAEGKVSSWRWLGPCLGVAGNDRVSIWLLDGTPSTDQLELIERNPGALILISGEPSLSAEWLYKLPAGCRVVCDGTCRSWYMERMTAIYPLIYSTSGQGAYRIMW